MAGTGRDGERGHGPRLTRSGLQAPASFDDLASASEQHGRHGELIEYPRAGVAAALKRAGILSPISASLAPARTPRHVLLDDTAALCGKPVVGATLATQDELCRDQLMSMKTTFTPET